MCPKLPKHFAFSKYFVQVGRDCNSVYVEEKIEIMNYFGKYMENKFVKTFFLLFFILFIFCPTHDKGKSKSLIAYYEPNQVKVITGSQGVTTTIWLEI